jgi:hypothetical protein
MANFQEGKANNNTSFGDENSERTWSERKKELHEQNATQE